MKTTIGTRAWADLEGDPETLDLVRPPGPPIALSSTLDAAGILGDCVGLATLAAAEIQVARGLLSALGPVRVDGARVTTASQSERHFQLNGEIPEVWAPYSGFWQVADGWVRTHGNYPHHAERLAHLLGIASDSSKDQIAAAIARWSAIDLEDEAAASGAIAGAVRTSADWAQHPHGQATSRLPLVEWLVTDGAAPRPWAPTSERPLSGVRILDLTRVLAGPIATRNLALLGADVLRIDSPHLPETDWIHLDTGAGKRSTVLDLRVASDHRAFEELLDDADVVVTGYRPGALDRLGFSPEALAERQPGIVVGSVSAWGRRGPWGSRRGFDSIVQAVTGIAMRVSADGVRPGALPAQALDHSAGYLLTAGICRALRLQRERGGTTCLAVALAGIARELLTTTGGRTDAVAEPTLQAGTTAAGSLICAMPPLVGPDIPDRYPALAAPWGSDEPCWRDQVADRGGAA